MKIIRLVILSLILTPGLSASTVVPAFSDWYDLNSTFTLYSFPSAQTSRRLSFFTSISSNFETFIKYTKTLGFPLEGLRLTLTPAGGSCLFTVYKDVDENGNGGSSISSGGFGLGETVNSAHYWTITLAKPSSTTIRLSIAVNKLLSSGAVSSVGGVIISLPNMPIVNFTGFAFRGPSAKITWFTHEATIGTDIQHHSAYPGKYTLFTRLATLFENDIPSMSTPDLETYENETLLKNRVWQHKLTSAEQTTAQPTIDNLLSLISDELDSRALETFNTAASDFEDNIPNMTLEELQATTTETLQADLGYNDLSADEQTTADPTIANLMNLVNARILELTTETWTAHGRTNAYYHGQTYDTDEATAPLKVTTADTQLLHDLSKNPIFTRIGEWQFKDTTNDHTWEFDPTTSIWSNTSTGYTWKHGDTTPRHWSQEDTNMSWVFDENTKTWSQTIPENE